MERLRDYKFVIAIALVFVVNYFAIPYDMPRLVVLDLVSVVLIIIITTQLRNAKISDSLFLILAGLGVCHAYVNHNELLSVITLPLFNLIIGVIILFLCKIVFKKEILHPAELKMLFISGLFLSIENVAAFYLIISFFGILTAMYWRWCRIGIYYSFGLPVSISLYFSALFGKNLNLTFLLF